MRASASVVSVHVDTPHRPYLSINGCLLDHPGGRAGGSGPIYDQEFLSSGEGRGSWVKRWGKGR